MRNALRSLVAIAAIVALAPTALAAPPPDHQVFTDGINDGGPLAPDFTPPWQDLTAGYISDAPDTLSFTWEVADLSVYPPGGTHFYWEFGLAPTIEEFVACEVDASACFSLRVTLNNVTGHTGSLRANCTTTGNVVSCEPIEAAQVTVTVDGNFVTATLQRSDLGSPDDGTILAEQDLFQGIGAYTGYGLIAGAMGDLAEFDAPGYYTFGQNQA